MIKNKIIVMFLMLSAFGFSQEKDTVNLGYKKRVLESIEVDFLSSYYKQDGVHSSVSGGMGSENLSDFATNIVVAVPLNDDDVLSVDAGISAYTSASSSNINPFDKSKNNPSATPWQASSGASAQDVLAAMIVNYSHSSADRNLIWNADVAFSNEYDYTSIGFGGGISKLFNQKNTEISLKTNVYLDQWRPIYPKELQEFGNNNFFNGFTIYDQNGIASSNYLPSSFLSWNKNNRNSYSASFGFSQVVTQKMQFSLFFDLLQQRGALSTPYHRIYFADKANYYIGQPQFISVYETTQNTGVYHLADAIEQLPDTRFKIPFGARLNYYLSEKITLRTYYRYYWDDWGITSHTASLEIPIKISDKFTFIPTYRYYTQKESTYFAPYDKHLSTEKFYTSDYDLSSFNANQYGLGVSYTDIFTAAKISIFGLKNIDFRYNHYQRTDGLRANIVTLGVKFVQQ